MKITIFGATGETGRLLVEQALTAGHQVVAFARNPSKLDIKNDQLTVVQGELNDIAAIERAVSGADAVISALGPRGNNQNKPITQGTQNILAAMEKQGVRRIIAVSTPSATDPNDLPDFKFKLLVGLIKFTMRDAYEEIIGVAEAIRTSDRDWTLVRVPFLNNKPKTGKVNVGYLGQGKIKVPLSRADLVGFILEQVQDTKYVRQSPAISN